MFAPVISFLLIGTLGNTTTSTRINSVMTHPHKILGSVITTTCSPQEKFTQMKVKLEEKLNNIGNAEVSGEYKLADYEQYALPSMRYQLSIHNPHTVHLDMLVKSFIKKWLPIPSRGVSDYFILTC